MYVQRCSFVVVVPVFVTVGNAVATVEVVVAVGRVVGDGGAGGGRVVGDVVFLPFVWGKGNT